MAQVAEEKRYAPDIVRARALPKERNVFRLDTMDTHGWQVRFRREGSLSYKSKFFNDKAYRRPEDAYEAAIFWRDEVEGTLPPASDGSAESADVRSRSGVPGIHLTRRILEQEPGNDGQPRVSHSLQVVYHDESDPANPGKKHQTTFSLASWTLADALVEATNWLRDNGAMEAEEVQAAVETAYANLSALSELAHVKRI